MSGLVGRPLALAAHPICRELDPDHSGVSVAEVEVAMTAAGLLIAGRKSLQVLGSALNGSQDLFVWLGTNRWSWLDPVVVTGTPISGRVLAEEAYRIAMKRDPERAGLHYETIKSHLLEEGVIIRGPNQGKTMFATLNNAKRLFDWISAGTFRWK